MRHAATVVRVDREATERFPARCFVAGLLAQLALCRIQRRLAWIKPAAGERQADTTRSVTVLAGDEGAAPPRARPQARESLPDGSGGVTDDRGPGGLRLPARPPAPPDQTAAPSE